MITRLVSALDIVDILIGRGEDFERYVDVNRVELFDTIVHDLGGDEGRLAGGVHGEGVARQQEQPMDVLGQVLHHPVVGDLHRLRTHALQLRQNPPRAVFHQPRQQR